MFEYKDQLNNIIKLGQYPPKRIISLVPSQTELLHYLGLEEEVIGITKFCVHPQSWFKTKQRIGGTKNVDIEQIQALQPDLIIANKEENVKEQVEQLQHIAPVWISDINNYADALQMIKSIGEITGKQEKAETLITQIEATFKALPSGKGLGWASCAYLIWRNPYMTIGGGTFINDMLLKCGLRNVFENETRYPEISIEMIKEKVVKLILLSSEPYPFNEKHAAEIKLQIPGAKVLMVNGEMFSWYGSRMLMAAQYFSELVNYIYTTPKDNSGLA